MLCGEEVGFGVFFVGVDGDEVEFFVGSVGLLVVVFMIGKVEFVCDWFEVGNVCVCDFLIGIVSVVFVVVV